jgi:hypothetical protein
MSWKALGSGKVRMGYGEGAKREGTVGSGCMGDVLWDSACFMTLREEVAVMPKYVYAVLKFDHWVTTRLAITVDRSAQP